MEISIAARVYGDPTRNKTEGDIVEIMPSGHQWGLIEVKNFLIIEMTLPQFVTWDMAQMLKSAYYADGVFYHEIDPPIAKRRFNVDFSTLAALLTTAKISVEWPKVLDLSLAYQPISVQLEAPGGKLTFIDPTKIVNDKYTVRKIAANDFRDFMGVIG